MGLATLKKHYETQSSKCPKECSQASKLSSGSCSPVFIFWLPSCSFSSIFAQLHFCLLTVEFIKHNNSPQYSLLVYQVFCLSVFLLLPPLKRLAYLAESAFSFKTCLSLVVQTLPRFHPENLRQIFETSLLSSNKPQFHENSFTLL